VLAQVSNVKELTLPQVARKRNIGASASGEKTGLKSNLRSSAWILTMQEPCHPFNNLQPVRFCREIGNLHLKTTKDLRQCFDRATISKQRKKLSP